MIVFYQFWYCFQQSYLKTFLKTHSILFNIYGFLAIIPPILRHKEIKVNISLIFSEKLEIM